MAPSGNDTECLPDLDEFLTYTFIPDISDHREEVRRQENADGLGLESNCFDPFISCADGEDSEAEAESQSDYTTVSRTGGDPDATLSPSNCRLVRI